MGKERIMRSLFGKVAPYLLLAILVSPALIIGCRSQDTVEYNQWEHETHREHVDPGKRSAAEQDEYQRWRQSHHDQH
jgi:hypothetical protein